MDSLFAHCMDGPVIHDRWKEVVRESEKFINVNVYENVDSVLFKQFIDSGTNAFTIDVCANILELNYIHPIEPLIIELAQNHLKENGYSIVPTGRIIHTSVREMFEKSLGKLAGGEWNNIPLNLKIFNDLIPKSKFLDCLRSISCEHKFDKVNELIDMYCPVATAYNKENKQKIMYLIIGDQDVDEMYRQSGIYLS